MARAHENYYVDLTASPVRHAAAPAAPSDIAAERLARKRARDREYQRVRRANARAARDLARREEEAAAEMEDFENYIDAAVFAAAAAAAIEAEGVRMRARQADDAIWPVYEKEPESPEREEYDDRAPGSLAVECAICLGGGKKWASLACGHVFCEGCVRKALAFRPNCPTCRAPARPSDVRRLFI